MDNVSSVCVLVALVVWLMTRLLRVGRRDAHLPNGPPTIPILGNLHMFPKSNAKFKFTEWARTYGGIYSLKMGPGTAIILTDKDIVRDLMDKRSNVTADRPPNHVVDLISEGMEMSTARYGETWRTLRRVSREMLSQQACTRHISIQYAESKQLLYDFLTRPEDFYTHIRRYSSSVILSALFGKRAPRYESRDLTAFFGINDEWESLLTPGVVPPVDFLPFLKYLPAPLASWKKRCEDVRCAQRALFFGLLGETEERIAKGYENGSFIEQVLKRQSELNISRDLIGYLGGVMIEGGFDTTSSWMQTLVLAMIAYPEAQFKAHAELDRVVGHERVPTMEDLPHLPYIQAVIKECHRWRPVGPMGVPHASTEDIKYRDFHIPAGTMIIINVWGMSQDPQIYERPEDFWPDRWMMTEPSAKTGANEADLREHSWFGNGRRFCPGVQLAHNSLAINTLNLLWAFEIGPEINAETGRPVAVDVFNYNDVFVSRPHPFGCTIKPRSDHHAQIIEHEFAAAQETFVLYEHDLQEDDREFVKAQRK